MVDRIVCARTSWPLEVAASHLLRKLRLRAACKFRGFKLIDGRTRIGRSGDANYRIGRQGRDPADLPQIFRGSGRGELLDSQRPIVVGFALLAEERPASWFPRNPEIRVVRVP